MTTDLEYRRSSEKSRNTSVPVMWMNYWSAILLSQLCRTPKTIDIFPHGLVTHKKSE